MNKVIINIPTMECSSCSNDLEKVLKNLDWLKSYNINIIKREISIFYDENLTSKKDILSYLKKNGFKGYEN